MSDRFKIEGRDSRGEVVVIETAANDFEAGMRAEQFQPHAVLLDVMGDQKDAGEILSNLRSNTSLAATRVVAVAGPLTAGQRQSLLRNGFDAVISKPYKLDELRRVIEEATNLVS